MWKKKTGSFTRKAVKKNIPSHPNFMLQGWERMIEEIDLNLRNKIKIRKGSEANNVKNNK